MDDSVVNGDTNETPRAKEKRFGCIYCDRLFARKEHADRHSRTHTQEKPFHCPQCDSRFTRSDLLVRHERLTHKKAQDDGNHPSASKKRKKSHSIAGDVDVDVDDSITHTPSSTLPAYTTHRPSMMPSQSSPAVYSETRFTSHRDSGHDFLATLSFAAEQAALQDSLATSSNIQTTLPAPPATMYKSESMDFSYPTAPGHVSYPIPAAPAPILDNHHGHQDISLLSHGDALEYDDSLDSLAAFLDSGALSSYHFSGTISAEQPAPFFSPSSPSFADGSLPDTGPHVGSARRSRSPTRHEEHGTFSRFGSRLPSLQPEERGHDKAKRAKRRGLTDVTQADREMIIEKFHAFAPVVAPGFKIPSRMALSRYLAAYVSGFHEHLPFLHLPTMDLKACSIELILAMAGVGAQYCFEADRGIALFHASHTIAVQRMRRRDARLSSSQREYRSASIYASRESVPYSVGPQAAATPDSPRPEENLIQTAQALLLLMAMGTWHKHKEILREALAIPSVLATIIREDGLKQSPIACNGSWENWIRLESVKRTKLLVFCFFNLHCVVYNIPALILNSEIKMDLPSSAAEFRAPNEQAWREAVKRNMRPPTFEDALGRLFARDGKDITQWNTSLGNYILIHAIIQHIFFVRQTAKGRIGSSGQLLTEDITALEQALRNWQTGWRRNPESSLDPADPNGPVAFNSTALMRLAYIRLNIDTGPGRALDTRDPYMIANAFREAPAIKRTPKLVRAVLHCAHALSIPIKIGVRYVAHTHTFIWSIQHSLCSLECAILLSKWLEALSEPRPEPEVTEDERRIVGLVKTMLDETEFAVPVDVSPESLVRYRYLSAGVLRVWATIFRGAQTWAIVDVIGAALNIFADMLEGEGDITVARSG